MLKLENDPYAPKLIYLSRYKAATLMKGGFSKRQMARP
jgi:hypothetical protein